MPPRGGCVAPQFITTKSSTPLAFEHYWHDLEQHFDTTGITDLRQKKQWAVHYPNVQTAMIMKGVVEYTDNAVTWDAYKKAIKKLYIGDTDDRQWTISDLTYLCGEVTCKLFMSLYEFCSFKHSFMVIYSYLKGQNKLSDTEASHMLFMMLDSHIINTVASHLAIVCQDHLLGDPYPCVTVIVTIAAFVVTTHTVVLKSRLTFAPVFNNVEEVEGVLDGGCQIVTMSKHCASNLGIMWNPDECINLQSANGIKDKMLSLAHDIPFCFHSMMVYLQCHIVDTPANNILLSRPFYKLTSAVTCSFVTGEESLTLKNPSNGKHLMFPTYCHGDAHYKVSAYTHAEFNEVEGLKMGFQTVST
ncbi:hypothetical protein FISHEDRAFT_35771 [Fistulina hepatica ATCC 64428]|uniref:Uncharacterized protein n=1 Tax=Fistulina hepatica ATCC 64428 TaxID=1128425 RepID=A0A0D7AMT9_9AGAR|nr:hypothetical protein FISHEDRAFT_35771 [Fistulina hepatica ATCC 64428]